MDAPENAVQPKSRAGWRQWLQKHHTRTAGLWLISYKKATGKRRFEYEAAVEALEIPLYLRKASASYPAARPSETRRIPAMSTRCWLIFTLLLLTATVRGNDTLIHAAARGNTSAVQRMLDAGAPVNDRDARGRNAVLAATQGGYVETAKLLIARGADVNAQDDIRDSAFLLAGARGHTEIVRAALAAGANLKSTNRYGGTALIPACHYGHVDTVQLLLTSAIDVNHINNLGWTALLEAVILGDGGARHSEIVKHLIAHGANVNLADKQGVTPLAHAEQRGQRTISELLRAAGALTRKLK